MFRRRGSTRTDSRQSAPEAVSPDRLASILIDRVPEQVLETAARHRASLRKPPLRPAEYLRALRNGGLDKTADWLESRWLESRWLESRREDF
jgi:hypothetical protein